MLLVIERQIDYIVEAVMKIQRERLKSMEVKKEAVDDFDEYLDVSYVQLLDVEQPPHNEANLGVLSQSYFPKVCSCRHLLSVIIQWSTHFP